MKATFSRILPIFCLLQAVLFPLFGDVRWERNLLLEKKKRMEEQHYYNHHVKKWLPPPPPPEEIMALEPEEENDYFVEVRPEGVVETYMTPEACKPVICNCMPMPLVSECVDDNENKEHKDGNYRIKIGDAFMFNIYGEQEKPKKVVVDPTGSISFSIVHSHHVLGKTVDEVRRELTKKLQKEIKFVLVSMTPQVFTSQRYTIMGEVTSPGVKPLQGTTTVLDALASAGGINYGPFRGKLIEYGDLNHAFLARKGEYVSVDFRRLVHGGDTTQNVKLESGDYIYIPTITTQNVYILGEVGKPAAFEFYTTVTLREAIAYAGGTTLRASSRVAIIRGSLCNPIKYLVDFNRILKGCECDIILEPGDIVFVPARKFSSVEDIFRGALNTMVSTVATSAANRAFLSVVPNGLVQPSIFFNGSGVGGTTVIQTVPVSP